MGREFFRGDKKQEVPFFVDSSEILRCHDCMHWVALRGLVHELGGKAFNPQ